MLKLDLVQIILTEYQDCIQPSIQSELKHIAENYGVSIHEVWIAMHIAVDIIQSAAEDQTTLDEAFADAFLEGNKK